MFSSRGAKRAGSLAGCADLGWLNNARIIIRGFASLLGGLICTTRLRRHWSRQGLPCATDCVPLQAVAALVWPLSRLRSLRSWDLMAYSLVNTTGFLTTGRPRF